MLAEEVEHGGRAPIVDRDDVAGAVVDLERGGRHAGGELVEIAVDLELRGDAGVTAGENVARELGVADDVAGAVHGAQEEVGLADQLDRVAVEGNDMAEAGLVDGGRAVSDCRERPAFALVGVVLQNERSRIPGKSRHGSSRAARRDCAAGP